MVNRFRLPVGVSREDVRTKIYDHFRKPFLEGHRKKIPDFVVAATISLFTGRRRSEILKLLRNDINWKNGTITFFIVKKKDPSRRVVQPVSRRFLKLLRKLRESRGRPLNEPVLKNTTNPRSISWGFRRRAKKHGLNIRFHDLRHLYALKLVQEGAPLPVIRKLLQHSSLKITSLYLEFNPLDARERVDF